MLKKPKNLDRGLKSWGIFKNGLYFENIEKKNQTNKCKGVKTALAKNDIDFSRDIDFRRLLYCH